MHDVGGAFNCSERLTILPNIHTQGSPGKTLDVLSAFPILYNHCWVPNVPHATKVAALWLGLYNTLQS